MNSNPLIALFDRIDGKWLVMFRILFGVVMLWEVYFMLYYEFLARSIVQPVFHFKYPMFTWLGPLPEMGMYILIYLMGLLAILIIVGLFYRIAISLFLISFTYLFLIDYTFYLNHFYLVILVAFLMIFLPANYRFSVDSIIWPQSNRPAVRRWMQWILAFQIGIPYFFGGIAKLNPDWLQGEPMGIWLSRRVGFPFIGAYFDQHWIALIFSYSGLLLDLFAVPLMIFKKTRPIIFTVLLGFHLMNDRLWNIGVFPWLMIGSMILFMSPNWIDDALADIRVNRKLQFAALSGCLLIGAIICFETFENRLVPLIIGSMGVIFVTWSYYDTYKKTSIEAGFSRLKSINNQATVGSTVIPMNYLTLVLIGLWVIIQLAIPVRKYFIKGYSNWTGEGTNFSWHMKLNDVNSMTVFYAADPINGKKTKISIEMLTDKQHAKLFGSPNLVHAFASYLQGKFEGTTYEGFGIYAHCRVSLNGRKFKVLIDPNVDLTKVSYRYFSHNPWIIDLPDKWKIDKIKND